MIHDIDSENKDVIAELAQRYEVKKVVVLTYHPKANEMIEHGNKSIVDTLCKMLDGKFTN